MNKKTIGLMVALFMVATLFSACARPATTSPTSSVVEATSTNSEIPFPVATQPQIMADILKQTQTAMALSTSDTSFPSAATSTPSFSFETPTPSTTLAVGGEATPTSAILSTSLPTSAPQALATAAPTKITYPTPTPGRPATYTIQAGEYLWCLARRFDVVPADLLSLNGMNANSQPYAGTSIKIPQSGSFGAGRARYAHPATYTVRAGDTIGGIACWYGDADPNTIFAANGLPANSIITVGQVLQIP